MGRVSFVSLSWVPGGLCQILHLQALGDVGGLLQVMIPFLPGILPFPLLDVISAQRGRLGDDT